MSSKETTNSSILMSMRLKKKPKVVEPLPELGDDIADDHALNTYRPGINVDDSTNNSGTMKKSSTLSEKRKMEVVAAFSSSNQISTMKNTCGCCTRPLVRKDKAGLVNYNFPKCKVCNGKICRNCLDNGKCHECLVSEALKNKMIPDLLLKIDRVSLLGYVQMLHYPMDVMKNYDSKYLVKQILVRFGCGSDWDPKFHSDSNEAINLQEHRKHSVSTNNDSDGKNYKANENFDKDLADKIDAAFEERLLAGAGIHSKAKDNGSLLDSIPDEVPLRRPHGDGKYDRPISSADRFKIDITKGLQNSINDKVKREVSIVRQNTSFNLLDIKSPAYFDGLSAPELRAILNQHSVSVNPDLEKYQLKFEVLKLWNHVKEEAAMAPVPQMHTQHRASDEVRMLHDISSVDLLDDLSTNQMISLMMNHGKSIGKMSRQDLLYELKRMWQEMQNKQFRPQLLQHQERVLSLSDIRSASEIEKLSINQLRGLLINNDINPKNHSEIHEMKYMIRQLWYRTQLKDNVRATLNRSIDSPKTFTDHHRSSMRAQNLSGSKSMNQLDRLDDPKSSNVKFNPFSRAPTKPNVDTYKLSKDESIETDSWQPQQRPLYVKQLSMPVLAISLEEIRHPDDIQELNLNQLRHILKSRNIDTSRMADKAELSYHVKELWMAKKAHESEIERRNGHANNYNKSAFVPVNHHQVPIGIELGLPLPNAPHNFDQYQSSPLQRVISLQDITKPDLIATLSTMQMKALLEKYKIHISDPRDKAALMELTRRLWTQRNGETVVNYMTLPQAQEATPVYAKITPSALRKSFRSEEQLRMMDQPAPISPPESEVINRNPMQLVEVRAGETAVSQKAHRSSGMWREEDFRTSSPITVGHLQAPTQNNINDVVNEIASIQSLEDIPSMQIISRLTVRQMKYILSKHEVDFAGCSEKKEFEIHLRYLWKKNRNKKYPNY